MTKGKTYSRDELKEIERARLLAGPLAETVQVLAQPHRLGDNSDMTDPLGVFVRAHGCNRRCYDGGWEYYRLVYAWRRAKGVPNSVRLDEFANTRGGELDEQTIDGWERKIKTCEKAMRSIGLSAFKAAQALLLQGILPSGLDAHGVKLALKKLVSEIEKCW